MVASLVFFETGFEWGPACPIYTLSQFGHASWYTPLFWNLSWVLWGCWIRVLMVCFVLNATWIPSFWKILVIFVVSCPKYVKMALFLGGWVFLWSICLCGGGVIVFVDM